MFNSNCHKNVRSRAVRKFPATFDRCPNCCSRFGQWQVRAEAAQRLPHRQPMLVSASNFYSPLRCVSNKIQAASRRKSNRPFCDRPEGKGYIFAFALFHSITR